MNASISMQKSLVLEFTIESSSPCVDSVEWFRSLRRQRVNQPMQEEDHGRGRG